MSAGPDDDGPLAKFGKSLATMMQLAIEAYAREFPQAASGLMLEVAEGTTRLQLIATVGGAQPSELRVLAITEGRDVLQLARMEIVAPRDH